MLIGELAERVGVNTKTVRYYESIGLVSQAPRTSCGYRIYGHEDEVRVAFIKSAQHLGLSLEEIREVLALQHAGRAPCEHVRRLLQNHIHDITECIIELHRLREELPALDAVIDNIPGDDAVVCRIIEHHGGQDEFMAGARRESTPTFRNATELGGEFRGADE